MGKRIIWNQTMRIPRTACRSRMPPPHARIRLPRIWNLRCRLPCRLTTPQHDTALPVNKQSYLTKSIKSLPRFIRQINTCFHCNSVYSVWLESMASSAVVYTVRTKSQPGCAAHLSACGEATLAYILDPYSKLRLRDQAELPKYLIAFLVTKVVYGFQLCLIGIRTYSTLHGIGYRSTKAAIPARDDNTGIQNHDISYAVRAQAVCKGIAIVTLPVLSAQLKSLY